MSVPPLSLPLLCGAAARDSIVDGGVHDAFYIDRFAFMNQHCGLNYETCDWSAGTGNVHPSAMGFEALAGKMFTAVKTLAASD